jgi:uncharacterized protein (DUF433 family)
MHGKIRARQGEASNRGSTTKDLLLVLRIGSSRTRFKSRLQKRRNGIIPIMKPSATTTWRYLAPNPKSCYKQLFIKGTRIRARVLYGMFMSAGESMTPQEIADEFDLPLAAVQEAIAYCQGNPPEIAMDFKREERLMDASGMNDPDYKRGGRFKVVAPEEVARILKS